MKPPTISPPLDNSRHIAVVSLGLFSLLVGVYLLSYSGVYHSGDEVGYVRDAINLIKERQADLGHGGPFAALLAAFILLTQGVDFVGTLQAVFLVNVATTGLAAVVVFLLCVELAYDWRAALLVALVYGLASPAWVYSKLLFRDPFVALTLVAMAYFLIRFRRRWSFVSLALAVLAGALAFTTRPSTAIVAPFAFLYVGHALLGRTEPKVARPRIGKLITVGIILGLLALVIFVVASAFTAYTKWLDRLLGFFSHFDALLGLLVSPGRGAFFYAPVLLLSVIGLVRFARRHAWETLLLWGAIPFYVLIVSVHPMWWGGWNWGPRYLVPVMPMLLVPLVELIEPMIAGRTARWLAIPAALVVLLSILTQGIGTAIGSNTASFQNMEPATFSQWQFTPLAQLAPSARVALDVAWAYVGSAGNAAVAIVACLAVVALGTLVIWLARTPARVTAGTLALVVGVTIVTIGVTIWLVAFYSTLDTRYQSPAGFAEAIERVSAQARAGDVLIYDHPKPADVHKYPSLVSNYCRLGCPSTQDVTQEHWATTSPPDKRAWLEKIRWANSRAWLITTDASQADSENSVRSWLDTYLFQSGCDALSAEVSLCQYDIVSPGDELVPLFMSRLAPPAAAVYVPAVISSSSPKLTPQRAAPSRQSFELDTAFGDVLTLSDVGLYWSPPNPETITPEITALSGAPLLVELFWQARAPIDTSYRVLLQLLDSAGHPVLQIERDPIGGTWPTTAWRQGELISDRYAFELADTLPAGRYQLALSVIDPATGARLPAKAGDSIRLAELTIVSPP